MRYYPVYLDIADKNCLVVGGGPVGARKAGMLEKCGARVTAVAMAFSDAFQALAPGSVRLEKKAYESSDLSGMFLVIAATDNADLNSQIRSDTEKEKILCNLADNPMNSDFILPSVVDKGDLVISVSTSGQSPAMAKKIRKDIERQFGPEYETTLTLMGNLRKRLLAEGHAPEVHRKVFHSLIDGGILEMIQAGNEMKINTLLAQAAGKGCQYQDLVHPGGAT